MPISKRGRGIRRHDTFVGECLHIRIPEENKQMIAYKPTTKKPSLSELPWFVAKHLYIPRAILIFFFHMDISVSTVVGQIMV